MRHDHGVDDDTRRRALLALDLVAGGRPDDQLAGLLGGADEAAASLARLAGHLVQLLAVHRGEDVAETCRFVRHTIRRA